VVQNEDYVIELLADTGLVTGSQLERARSEAKGDTSVIDRLIENEVVTQEDVTRAVASSASMDFVDLSQMAISPEAIAEVPSETARRYRVVPVTKLETSLMMATGNPLDFDTFDAVSHVLSRDIEWVCSTTDQIDGAITKYYGTADGTADEATERLAAQLGGEIQIGDIGAGGEGEGEGGGEGDAPIIKMVTMMLLEAYKMRASDIHIEPLEKRCRVRFRIDGVLHEVQNPPKKLESAIISRLKIMTGSMSIAEKRLPQDGRIQVKIGKSSIDLRVSSIPTNHGESIVMRILDKSSLTLGLPQLVSHASRRHHPGHRANGLGQDNDALCVPELYQQAGPEDHHGRGPVRVPDEWDQSGPGERRYRNDVSCCAEVDPASSAEYHHDR
jgi:type IV pilus assembly protein PilB